MNVVDSSGWLEYLADGPNAGFFAKAIEATANLMVPTTSLYEVSNWKSPQAQCWSQSANRDDLGCSSTLRLSPTPSQT